MKQLTCRGCRKKFSEKPPGSAGFYNQCLDCAAKQEEPEPIGGNMIYLHKTGPYIELKPLSAAKQFAQLTRRKGSSVMVSLLERKRMSKEEQQIQFDQNFDS